MELLCPPFECELNLVTPFQQIEYGSGSVLLLLIRGIAASLLCLGLLIGKASCHSERALWQHSGVHLGVRTATLCDEPSWT